MPCPRCGKSDLKQLKVDAWKKLEVSWRTASSPAVPEFIEVHSKQEHMNHMQQYSRKEIVELQQKRDLAEKQHLISPIDDLQAVQ